MRGDIGQDEFGRRYGLSRQAVSAWETGDTLPRLKHLLQLSAAFDVRIDWILWGIQPKRIQAQMLDRDRLMAAASAVEEALQSGSAELTPEAHAKAILVMYDQPDMDTAKQRLATVIDFAGRPRKSSK